MELIFPKSYGVKNAYNFNAEKRRLVQKYCDLEEEINKLKNEIKKEKYLDKPDEYKINTLKILERKARYQQNRLYPSLTKEYLSNFTAEALGLSRMVLRQRFYRARMRGEIVLTDTDYLEFLMEE